MSTIAAIYNCVNASRLKQIEYFQKHPNEVQDRVLKELLRAASHTEQGERYGYSTLKSVDAYRSKVPVLSYDEILPAIEKARRGEANILWPGRVRWFAKSSGTTSTKSKFIPVTDESLQGCHYRGIKDLLAIFSRNFPDNKIFYGKALTLGGSHKISLEDNHALTGDLSAILLENAPRVSNFWKSPDKKTALIDDFERKVDLLTKTAVKQNITSMSGVPSWYLTLIKYVLSYTGKRNLSEIWPNLEVFFHGGISFSPYREIYKKLIESPRMKYVETYNASEGFFGIQDDPSDGSMLLMLDYGVYYEFEPIGSGEGETKDICSLGEVKKGVNYSLIISTNSGLWRYRIGDTITFTSLDPYKFKITGRTKHFINAFGEEVIVDNSDKAIAAACAATGATINDYTAGPVYMGASSKGTHEWIIDFEKEPSDLNKFIDVLDEKLKEVNSDYEAKRYKDINLVKPIVRIAPRGTFSNWLKSKNKLGGQNKVPRLSNTREFLEELYPFL